MRLPNNAPLCRRPFIVICFLTFFISLNVIFIQFYLLDTFELRSDQPSDSFRPKIDPDILFNIPVRPVSKMELHVPLNWTADELKVCSWLSSLELHGPQFCSFEWKQPKPDYNCTPTSPLRAPFYYVPVDKTVVPVITVAIPIYNTKPVLFEETLQSVLTQSLQEFEILIINDGSNNPDTVEMLKRYRQNPPVCGHHAIFFFSFPCNNT